MNYFWVDQMNPIFPWGEALTAVGFCKLKLLFGPKNPLFSRLETSPQMEPELPELRHEIDSCKVGRDRVFFLPKTTCFIIYHRSVTASLSIKSHRAPKGKDRLPSILLKGAMLIFTFHRCNTRKLAVMMKKT